MTGLHGFMDYTSEDSINENSNKVNAANSKNVNLRIDEIISWTVQYPHSPLNKTFSKTIDSTTYEYNIATTALHKPATYS